MGHIVDIFQKAKDNDYFRRVLETGPHTQVVIMSIPPGGEIGEETHADNDQVLQLVDGAGRVMLDGHTADFRAGDLVLVPAGTRHNFTAAADAPLKIVTTYSPPHHPDGTVHKTKAEADAAH